MKKIAVIGAGNMGSAIIKGIKKKHEVTASDIDKNKLKGLGVKTIDNNKSAVRGAGIIILAIKPQNMNLVLNDIRNIIKKRQIVISIAAGITTRKIENRLGKVPVVRVMPNIPLLVGEGISVICQGRYAKSAHIRTVDRIFSRFGKVIKIKDENLMDAITAISGSGPAYVYLFIESLIKSAIRLGLNKKVSELLVAQTVKGAIVLLEKTGRLPEELRRQVTSPGGTTEAALKVFEKKLFTELVHAAVHSAHKRSKELSR